MKDLKGVPGGEERILAELKTRAAVDPDFRKRLLGLRLHVHIFTHCQWTGVDPGC